MAHFTSAHWGIYETLGSGDNLKLRPLKQDPDPSPIGESMVLAYHSQQRVLRPSVRASCLAHGLGHAPHLRGLEPFVELEWDDALDLVAGSLRDVIRRSGNRAIFGGSYGWSSAGRFHHAQSQVHRFLNSIGGYVRHTDSYSLGAARVLMPWIVAPMEELMANHTSWDQLAANTTLFVSFGGVPRKNAQISPGGAGDHTVRQGLHNMARSNTRFVNISPIADDIETGGEVKWIPIRPNTDTALMLALAYTLYTEGRHNESFLTEYCVGFDVFLKYLLGRTDGQPKSPGWAEEITGVDARDIVELAHAMADNVTMLNISFSLQRAQYGEQPYWMLVTLAAMLGQIGLPGGGFGVGYGGSNMMGNANPRFSGPTLSQGGNAVQDFIPVARLADMLEHPGEPFDYNGKTYSYPSIELIYWAGGNPFHHHQDLNRLLALWRRVPCVIVNEQFWTATAKLADIVLPATSTLERDDIGYATRERYMVAMRRAMDPVGQARDDYEIFSGLAERLGVQSKFTENRTVAQWLQHMYEQCRPRAAKAGVALSDFDTFWEKGLIDLAKPGQSVIMLEDFRRDPVSHPLATPSGRIEILSEAIVSFGYADCPGHPTWKEPLEWLGANISQKFPLHLLSDQPHTKLHSQLDHSAYSRGNKQKEREPVLLHKADAETRRIHDGDIVRVFNTRGACLAVAVLSDRIAQGVIKLSTGAWLDIDGWIEGAIEKHGNPNVLTLDIGASRLSQGCAAYTCLVEVERYESDAPAVTAFVPPSFQVRSEIFTSNFQESRQS